MWFVVCMCSKHQITANRRKAVSKCNRHSVQQFFGSYETLESIQGARLAFLWRSTVAATLSVSLALCQAVMMAAKRKYYAVKSGHVPGVYDTWEDCKRQVDGFRGNQYKSFPSLVEAEQYLMSGAGSSIRVKEAKASVSVPVRKEKNRGPSHKLCGPVKKARRERSPLRKNAFPIGSSVLEFPVTDPCKASAADFTTVGERSSVQASLHLPMQLGAKEVSITDPDAVFRLEYDGASKGNPGYAGAGAVLRHPDGSVVCELMVGLGKTTNNVAEYRGLLAGLRKARDLGIQRLEVQGDSMLVTQQLRGVWAVKNENLAVLCREAKELVKGFKDFQIRHVDREWNSAADALANKGVGLPEEKYVSAFLK